MDLLALGAELPLEMMANGQPDLKCPVHGTETLLETLLDLDLEILPCGCERADMAAYWAEQSLQLAKRGSEAKGGDAKVSAGPQDSGDEHIASPASSEGNAGGRAKDTNAPEGQRPTGASAWTSGDEQLQNNGTGAGGQLLAA